MPQNDNPSQTTVSSDVIFQSLLYVPFPRGVPLHQQILNEFETVRDISFNCRDNACGAVNIGSKSRTTILENCQMGLIVSVTRRHHRTQHRISAPITLGDTIFTLHRNTPYEKSYELLGAVSHELIGHNKRITNTGHYKCFLIHDARVYVVDDDKAIYEGTMQDLRNAEIFLYKVV